MIEKPGLTLYGLFIVMVLLAAAALLLGVAVSSILVLLLIYAALAYSINFITGMIGYVDFGHVLFMAIGSYALATLVSYYGANPLLGVGLGALLGLVFALGIGLVILRFRGVYFAIATVVLVLAAYNLVLQFPQFGPGGEIIFNLTFQPLATYFTIWTIVLIEIVLTYYVNRSRIGFGIRAIKNEEDAASSVGVSPQTLKLTGYMLGGFFRGCCGSSLRMVHFGRHSGTSIRLHVLALDARDDNHRRCGNLDRTTLRGGCSLHPIVFSPNNSCTGTATHNRNPRNYHGPLPARRDRRTAQTIE